jgi:transcriptional/translational regulatory protein YebC/TACO1
LAKARHFSNQFSETILIFGAINKLSAVSTILCSKNGFTENERLSFIPAIHKNAIVSIQSLLKYVEDAKENLSDKQK